MRKLWSVLAAAGLLAALTPGAAQARPASAGGPPVPTPHWRPCFHGFQCATARVPLNYRKPHGQTISIAMTRHLATGQGKPLGSLFFNPGGPGGPGAEALTLFYRLFPAKVRARYDIVGFDPRGIGASTAVRCFPTPAAEHRFLARLPAGFPVGDRQNSLWERTYTRFDKLCADRNPALINHVTSADAARDMDLMRQAVHDRVLNYLGISYGTVLGASYANLFPGKVGAMILDGNLNPVVWTHRGRLPTGLRVGSDKATAATLRAFLTRCGRVPVSRCAFSAGSSMTTLAKYGKLLTRLSQAPVTIGHSTFSFASTVAAVSSFLEVVHANRTLGIPGWSGGARLLQRIWVASGARGAHRPAPGTGAQAAAAAGWPVFSWSAFYNGPEQQDAVLCTDSPNPRNPAAYPALDRIAMSRSGAVGLNWLWLTEPCAGWRGSSADRYSGPWNRHTAHPLLIVGNTGDPVTPYKGSVAMSVLLARARLLTVDGFGHTELLNPSTCAANAETRYLLTGTLPRAGTVCQQNGQPFPTSRTRS